MLTLREKQIISAYTGILMCDYPDFQKYVEELLGGPVFTHQLADKGILELIKERSREDFLKLCEETDDDCH